MVLATMLDEPGGSAAVMRRPCCRIGRWPQPASGVDGSVVRSAVSPFAESGGSWFGCLAPDHFFTITPQSGIPIP